MNCLRLSVRRCFDHGLPTESPSAVPGASVCSAENPWNIMADTNMPRSSASLIRTGAESDLDYFIPDSASRASANRV